MSCNLYPLDELDGEGMDIIESQQLIDNQGQPLNHISKQISTPARKKGALQVTNCFLFYGAVSNKKMNSSICFLLLKYIVENENVDLLVLPKMVELLNKKWDR